MADAERAAEVRVSGARCPFCHEEVQRGVEPVVCVACHALHHTECMAEHGACSACGASHPRFARVERPRVVASPRPRPEWHDLSLPRFLGRTIGLFASRGGMLVMFSLVAVAALVGALSARHQPHILLGLVALGVSVVGAAGTAFVDARRGLGAACVAAAPGVALVFAQTQHGRLSNGQQGLAVGLALVGALLAFWPTSRRWRA